MAYEIKRQLQKSMIDTEPRHKCIILALVRQQVWTYYNHSIRTGASEKNNRNEYKTGHEVKVKNQPT